VRAVTLAVVVVLAAVTLVGCATVSGAVPECRADQRLALVAQSVPTASYVPCLASMPAGWDSRDFRAESGETTFELASDRSRDPVEVELQASCRIGEATPIAPRADGARTYLRLDSVAPQYAGTLYDVFPGGCVMYRFHFERGAHIQLMEDFQGSIDLFSRRELRLRLERNTGVRLR
jgi:hypothetical protein